jgi:hypothetical protein
MKGSTTAIALAHLIKFDKGGISLPTYAMGKALIEILIERA